VGSTIVDFFYPRFEVMLGMTHIISISAAKNSSESTRWFGTNVRTEGLQGALPAGLGILDLDPIARRASAVSRFDTMPSRPSLHACWNTGGDILVSVFVELDAGGSLRQRLASLVLRSAAREVLEWPRGPRSPRSRNSNALKRIQGGLRCEFQIADIGSQSQSDT
jgi:hypothetical protein